MGGQQLGRQGRGWATCGLHSYNSASTGRGCEQNNKWMGRLAQPTGTGREWGTIRGEKALPPQQRGGAGHQVIVQSMTTTGAAATKMSGGVGASAKQVNRSLCRA